MVRIPEIAEAVHDISAGKTIMQRLLAAARTDSYNAERSDMK